MAVYKSKDPFRVKPWCCDTYKGSTRIRKYFATDRKYQRLLNKPTDKELAQILKIYEKIFGTGMSGMEILEHHLKVSNRGSD
jgi:hypothetical protein